MKKHLMIVMFAVMFLVGACSASPEQTSTMTPSVPATQSIESTWQTYTNAEAGFSIHYPYNWEVEAMTDDNEGQLHRVALKGQEGGLELHWGVGLGGACPDGYQPLKVAQGEIPACHGQKADGTELWSLAGKQLGDISFSGFAYTNDTSANSRDIVLQILSTLSFP
jgi:PsbP-like protein